MSDWQFQPARDQALSPLERTQSLKRESGLISTLGHTLWGGAIRSHLRVYHRLQIHGGHHLPVEPPFVLVANHASHLDALVLASLVPIHLRDRVFPIAAADVFFSRPSISIFASLMLNALPMHRAGKGKASGAASGRHALNELRTRLIEEPCGYILFPEGARSRDGEMLPVKSGIGMLVAESNVPVVPCWLEGCFRAMPPDAYVPRPRKIDINVGEPVRFPDAPNSREGWDTISAALEHCIVALRPTNKKPAAQV
jgi:1-acyl-sn-glycerol-3-phosphate acyltransferase